MWPRPTCQKQQVQQVQLDVHVHSELRLCAEHRINACVKLGLPDTWKLSRGLYKLGEGPENGQMGTGIAGNMVAGDVELSVAWFSPPFQPDNAIPWLSGRVFRDRSCLLPVLYHVCRRSLISSSLVALPPFSIYLFFNPSSPIWAVSAQQRSRGVMALLLGISLLLVPSPSAQPVPAGDVPPQDTRQWSLPPAIHPQ